LWEDDTERWDSTLSIDWTILTFPRKSKHLKNSDIPIINFQKANRWQVFESSTGFYLDSSGIAFQ
jgi:hypothetical protein